MKRLNTTPSRWWCEPIAQQAPPQGMHRPRPPRLRLVRGRPQRSREKPSAPERQHRLLCSTIRCRRGEDVPRDHAQDPARHVAVEIILANQFGRNFQQGTASRSPVLAEIPDFALHEIQREGLQLSECADIVMMYSRFAQIADGVTHSVVNGADRLAGKSGPVGMSVERIQAELQNVRLGPAMRLGEKQECATRLCRADRAKVDVMRMMRILEAGQVSELRPIYCDRGNPEAPPG